MSAASISGGSGFESRGRPIQPGQVLNPEGKNQWTYRRDFEHAVERLCSGEITEELLEYIPDQIRPLFSEEMSGGEALAKMLMVRALRGDEKCLTEALKRIWPATQKHEIDGDAAVVIVRDYSGGRDGREPQEVGAITVEAGEEGTYSAEGDTGCHDTAPARQSAGGGEVTGDEVRSE